MDAYLDKTELLPRTENTVTEKAELKKLLAAGRERGFCEEVEENEEGIRCVGAPILDLEGFPCGGGEHQRPGLPVQRYPVPFPRRKNPGYRPGHFQGTGIPGVTGSARRKYRKSRRMNPWKYGIRQIRQM